MLLSSLRANQHLLLQPYANLRGANLRGADLQGANLQEAYLRGVDLQGANLQNTCLDPEAEIPDCNLEDWVIREDGRLQGWRTKRSSCVGDNEYKIGQIYRAPVFSIARTECHPGLYVWPTRRDARNWLNDYPKGESIIEIAVKPKDLYQVGSKWRCREFEVIDFSYKFEFIDFSY